MIGALRIATMVRESRFPLGANLLLTLGGNALMAGGPRERWTSKRGFILAAIGSAVGLGNMWRFSYLAAENGGAAFVILYLGATLVIGLPVLLAELVLGRGSQKSPIQALTHYGGSRWKPLGLVFVAAGFLILSYYAVIAGWALRYGLAAIVSGFDSNAAAHFGEVAEGWDAFGFHVAFMALTVFVVVGGVSRGIERTSLVLMPLLFALVVGLALYAATLDGASAGYAYYLKADFSKLLSLNVVKDATGQAFFSLSLGMGRCSPSRAIWAATSICRERRPSSPGQISRSHSSPDWWCFR